MKFNQGFAISIISFALSASAVAMSHREDLRGHDRDNHGTYHAAANRGHDHDRDDRRPTGWDKGHKEGWKNRSLPPGQAKKHHHDRDHDRDRYRARRRHRDWDRDRDHRAVVRRPMPMGTKPVSQQDRNRAWGDNVRARKAEINQQQTQQKQQPYIKH